MSERGAVELTDVTKRFGTMVAVDRLNLAVEPGDTIDFIVSIHESLNNNDFIWSPVIRMTGTKTIRDAREWDAKKDFSGPPAQNEPALGPWERFAQALLLANEFLFVD